MPLFFIKLFRITIYLQTKELSWGAKWKTLQGDGNIFGTSSETSPGHGNNARKDAEMKMPQHGIIVI
jgi:hypothetical protein